MQYHNFEWRTRLKIWHLGDCHLSCLRKQTRSKINIVVEEILSTEASKSKRNVTVLGHSKYRECTQWETWSTWYAMMRNESSWHHKTLLPDKLVHDILLNNKQKIVADTICLHNAYKVIATHTSSMQIIYANILSQESSGYKILFCN